MKTKEEILKKIEREQWLSGDNAEQFGFSNPLTYANDIRVEILKWVLDEEVKR